MGYREKDRARRISLAVSSLTIFLLVFIAPYFARASDEQHISLNNFGLPGIIDLPIGKRLPDGDLVLTQQLHKSLGRTGISFQALPRLGVSFRYTGHGINGGSAYGRINFDRSFDAHISILDEGTYLPSISVGLRDFIGTGWYSSEYFVGTKSIGNFELTAGIGFGRLAGRNSFSNPLGALNSKFNRREANSYGTGGTFGVINWFQGDAAAFYGIQYHLGDKFALSAEYTPDLMKRESSYLEVKSPWNLGVSYKFNKYLDFSLQHLHGAQTSVTAKVAINPNRPPFKGGKELAPVPMRLRSPDALPKTNSNEGIIRKVLAADRFEIHTLRIVDETATIVVTNNKFRSTAQAVGRISSTLQRFTSDKVKFAKISFHSMGLRTATFHVDLEKINREQFDPTVRNVNSPSIFAIDEGAYPETEIENKFIWGVGPYFSHRLFNPDLPLSMETGIEIQAGFQLLRGLKVSGSMRKSVLTNLTKNKRLDSGSPLPRVHSEWPLYDMAGQNGHIYDLKISYVKNLMPGLYGHAHAGLLEPFFAGVGGEILYKPSQWPLGIGLDIHRVRKRDYDMRFDLLDFETTVGHVSFYYDAGGMFDIELNAGRFLAGDWGATTTISREFGSGWEVGGYATLTDVPFSTFGEGSFDKAIYISIPMDWLTSTPTRSQRILTLRPITRDGGANLASARSLNRYIKRSHNASFKREFGRLWK